MSRHRAQASRPKLLRLRAVLAGGLVVGVGMAVTLASWADREYGSASFTASIFDTQSTSAATSTGWASNVSAPGAALTFNATAMSPGTLQYATLNVRTTAATTVPGTIVLTSASTTGTLPTVLEYRLVRTATTSTACNATAFSGSTYIAGAATPTPTYLAPTTVPGVAVSSTLAAAGGEIRYCFEVRMQTTAPSSYQGATGTITWQFAATSDY